MSSLTIEIQRAENLGEKVIGSSFTGNVRSVDNPGLEEGDEFTFPETYDVRKQKLGDNEIEYIFVELANGDAKRFYPSTFSKSRRVYNEDKTPTNERAVTDGTAAEEYRSHATIDEAMKALKGKKVKVTKVRTIRTLSFDGSNIISTTIPTIDFA